MFWSKSFGYALRGILYIAHTREKKPRIQVDEIARELAVPKYFLGKVMKKIVQHGILNSTKGPYGGFSLHEETLSTTLFDLILITDTDAGFDNCVLRLKHCSASHPCALHHRMKAYREDLHALFTITTIGDLLNADKTDFIGSIKVDSKAKQKPH